MNILLVYPRYPETFWSFSYALRFVGKRALQPPLGLLTVAGMLPKSWDQRLVDLNVEKLTEDDLEWADYVLISAMAVQGTSAQEIIRRCQGKARVIAGGPLFTASHEQFSGVDHFILDEAESSLPTFLSDLENNHPKHIYRASDFPSMQETPIPRWDLVNMRRYANMNLQFSRGCPFNCEFCDITTLFGRKVRTKSKEQVLAELDALYENGWRGDVFFVDDNFIGHRPYLKRELLPAITAWMARHKRPFTFITEASMDLADDRELMRMMVRAGFSSVFLGIETPEEDSLAECNKFQNTQRNLLDSIRRLYRTGLGVTGGFIVGFDSDSPSIFRKQIEFIQKSGIVTAMVGLLNAPTNSPLYRRLKRENRLLSDMTGNNTDLSMNFIPKMDYQQLIEGYRYILEEIYSAKNYYARVRTYLREARLVQRGQFQLSHCWALIRSMFVLGIAERGRLHYWRLFFWSLFTRPSTFPLAITFAIYGYHFRQVMRRLHI